MHKHVHISLLEAVATNYIFRKTAKNSLLDVATVSPSIAGENYIN